MIEENPNFTKLQNLRADCTGLLKHPVVQLFREEHGDLIAKILSLTEKKKEVLLVIIALKQGHVLHDLDSLQTLNTLAITLCDMDEFYHSIGGVVGYQQFIHELITCEDASDVYDIEPPKPIDLRKHTELLDEYILKGIEKQNEICEILPCGGAADQLDLGLNIRKWRANTPQLALMFDRIYFIREDVIRDLVCS